MEQFLQELEEDPELRQRVALYRDQEALARVRWFLFCFPPLFMCTTMHSFLCPFPYCVCSLLCIFSRVCSAANMLVCMYMFAHASAIFACVCVCVWLSDAR